jgi:LemA protein
MQQTDNRQEQMQLGAELSKSLADVKMSVESYPELKADRQFTRLADSIEEIEYQIQAARRTFNAAAVDFNNYVQMFPSSIVASSKNYQPIELITITQTEAANVNVQSLFGKPL